MSRSLSREIDHLCELYGVRNRLYLTSLARRIDFLQVGIKDLLEVVRQDRTTLAKEVAIARVFARLVCVMEYFTTPYYRFPIVDILCKKYPAHGCSYCQQKPCRCQPGYRPNYKLETVADEDQAQWSISDWQNHMHAVYGHVNGNKTWEDILNRLVAESTEISNVEMLTHTKRPDELLKMYAKEVADTFAWICAVASKLELSLDVANQKAYGNRCWSCKQKPCHCESFVFEFVDWNALEAKQQLEGFSADTVPTES
jgi:hypothetical protein